MTEAQLKKQEVELSPPKREIELHNQRLEAYLEELDFENLSPEEILSWASATFANRAILETSFQYTGVAMIHMVAAHQLDLRIATLDTLRLPPETYQFIDQVKARYNCQVEVCKPDSTQIDSMTERFGEYLFFDSKALQEYCCQVRKERPHNELIKTADCWISGVRRDQSSFRRDTTSKASLVLEYGSRRKILKLNPMAAWNEEQLLEYIKTNDIPTHPLYAQGYPSIGCVICSTPTLPGEEKRAGRWRWFNNNNQADSDDKKECGLHVPGQLYNI
jgi:phosphoadenosine phosphosulfate reductase